MGQIIKSLASFCWSLCLSVCLSVLLRSHFLFDFDVILHRGYGAQKVKKPSKSYDPFPFFALMFHPRNAFSMGRSKYCSDEAHGPIVAVMSSNDVPRERLQA